MRRFYLFLLFFFFAFSFSLSQPKEPPKGERCVVCGMDVNMEPRLTSQVKLKDGSYKYAESPKHILRYYHENKDKVAELWVKDYKSGNWIDGRRAFYVVIKEGPMGNDLAAFKSRLDAQRFAQGPQSAKNKVYQFTEIDKAFLEHLEMGHVH